MRLDEVQAKKLGELWDLRFFPKVSGTVRVRGTEAPFERFSQHLPGKFMPLGSYSYSQSFFASVAKVGRYCSIGSRVDVMGNAHPSNWISTSPAFYRRKRSRIYRSDRDFFPHFKDVAAQVEIGHDVWVGNEVLFSHGVKVGTGSIIAARSVVTRDVPPFAIVAGVPARVVRLRFEEHIVERLLKSRWWLWPINCWDAADPRDVARFLDLVDIVVGTTKPMKENRVTARDLLDQF